MSLRSTALYHVLRLVAPDLSDPAVIAKLIAKDRAGGPKRPSRRIRRRFDFRETTEHGATVFRMRRKDSPPPRLHMLYIHGGGYVLDFQTPQWNLAAGLLDRIAMEVVAPVYPLGPEAGWRETMAALKRQYRALAEAAGPENIVVMGDSAGGGLALLLAQLVRDKGLPAPAALLLFSPSLDFSGSGADQPVLERRDPALSLAMFPVLAAMWAKDVPANDPRVSPLFADQRDLPPTMVFSGDRDILHSDALRLKAANPAVDHRFYPDMMHVWPGMPLPEARTALDEAAAFITAQCGSAGVSVRGE